MHVFQFLSIFCNLYISCTILIIPDVHSIGVHEIVSKTKSNTSENLNTFLVSSKTCKMRVPSVLIILMLTVLAAGSAADLLDFSTITVWTDDDVTKSYVQTIPIVQSFFVFDAMISTQRSSNPYFSFEYEVEFDINQQPARNITSLCGVANGKWVFFVFYIWMRSFQKETWLAPPTSQVPFWKDRIHLFCPMPLALMCWTEMNLKINIESIFLKIS